MNHTKSTAFIALTALSAFLLVLSVAPPAGGAPESSVQKANNSSLWDTVGEAAPASLQPDIKDLDTNHGIAPGTYPVITSTSFEGSNLTLSGMLYSTPGTTFTLVFLSSAESNPLGFTQGQVLIGSTMVTTEESGNASFGPLTFSLPNGHRFVSTTATKSFSQNIGVLDLSPHRPPQTLTGGQPTVATSAPYTTGDVFVGVGNGFIKHFSPAGVLLNTLNTGTGCAEDLGMAFTTAGHLLATAAFGTCFGSGRVVEFDNTGNLIGPFGGGYSSSTESAVIDALGNVYIGQPDGTRVLKKFNSAGAFLMDFSPPPQSRGTDWNDLAADQCTMFYTSEGNAIKRFDLCALPSGTPLPDFASSAASPKYALRIRSNGEVLVAATSVLERYSAAGALMQTYPFPDSLSFAMNLDPDGTHFWTADYFTGSVYRYDISSGAIDGGFPSTPFNRASGLALFNEPTVAVPTPTPPPVPTPTPTPPPTGTPHPHHVTPTPRPHVTPTPRPPHATPTPRPPHVTPTPMMRPTL